MRKVHKKFSALLLAAALMAALAAPYRAAAVGNTQENAGDSVKIGAEVLLESAEWKEYLKGKNVALFTNQVCVDRDMNHLADRLYADPDINLVCMFGGEHGLRGAYQAGAAVPHSIDPTTHLPVWSLYNGRTIDTEALGLAPLDQDLANPSNPNRPTLAMLTGNNGKWYEPVDVILFDLQEIGSKTWTYMYTLADCMMACVEAKNLAGRNVEFIVLDRPSTISSDVVEGTMTTPGNASGISRYPLPSRYGLTMGELAKLYQGEGYKNYWTTTYPGGPANEYGSTTAAPADWNWKDPSMEKKISLADCDLKVIPCEGYTRDMYWDETGLQFILPSPNMPTWEAALDYTGTVWFEGPTINEGRGTTKPFELISAPYIDPIALARRMNELELPGVRFRAASITPYIANQTPASYANILSHGMQIHITDKRAFSPIEMQVALFLTLQAMYGGSGNDHFNIPASVDLRTGSTWVRTEVNAFLDATEKEDIPAKTIGKEDILAKTAEMVARMEDEMQDYLAIRAKYLMDEYNTPAGKELVTTPQPRINLGYEALLAEHMDLLAGKRVGLFTNQTGVDKNFNHLADVLKSNAAINLTTLFSPEFGLRGEFQTAAAGDYVDNVTGSGTGLPVHRLYGTAPTADQLKNVDILLFDLQDSGTRSNSYVKLMANCMLACAENGVTFVVLDRPNPLGGADVDGPVPESGGYPIPTRYGMTMGELALMIKGEFEPVSLKDLDLKVISMEGWTRDMYYDETGLQFVMPDRKIPTAKTALTYASLGWLEGSGEWASAAASQKGVSSGWGTTKTYEFFGAPFIQPQMVEFAKALNDCNLPGIRFRMAAMTPWNNLTSEAAVKFPNTACYGVQMHIYDEHTYSPVDTALAILVTLQERFPEKVAEMFTGEFDEIVGNTWIKDAIKNGDSADKISAEFQEDVDAFLETRQAYLLYSLDKTDLDALIGKAEGKSEGDYTAASWAPFAAALESAKKVSADHTATQAEIDTALDDLRVKMQALAEQPVSDGYYSNTTRTTKKNDDGSTTVTVTNKATGTVTETTTWSDGSKKVIETKKDGTVTTTAQTKDGVKSVTVTTPEGKTTSTVTLPGSDSATVTIPVKNAGPGTVAYLVKDDGTSELIPDTRFGKDSVSVRLSGPAKLEVSENGKAFADVPGGHWAQDAVRYVTARELFQGTGADAFSPSRPMSRAMLVTVLHRLAGVPTAEGVSFPDVEQDSWYSKAVAWANKEGIVLGTGEGFGPDAPITRESLAAILFRYAQKQGLDMSAEGTAVADFADSAAISPWAAEAMSWAVANGILTGKAGGLLDPAGTASRAEVAMMLMRFMQDVVN
ncbi:conserved exported hypothetical protein [uncultured Eubacteriales bacterium]|uniref:SLH domain-containing protein n=1 Tax=uncultured Eubacteriales bacterium TaxID=172733 RepID=A0A212KBA7_9FIRM|nr:conserved exported hypothetical protein [uncultured Eubacteriales bacterium]